MPVNSANTCILCHKHQIHSDSDGSLRRRTIELRQSLINVLATLNEGRDNLSQAIEVCLNEECAKFTNIGQGKVWK